MKDWRRIMLILSFGLFIFSAVHFLVLYIGNNELLPLACDASKWDFGVRASDQNISHQFIVTNVSGSDLQDISVVPGCPSCTNVTISTSKLRDRDSAKVLMKVSLKGRRGKTAFRASIAPEGRPPLILQITGVVQPDSAKATKM